MQVTETVNEGLKRAFTVVIEAKAIDEKVSARLDELKDQVQLKGFRPGKVPLAHLRKVYGKSVTAEVLEKMVTETSAEALKERELKPAFQPEIKLPEDEKEIEAILSGKQDATYTMEFEILPEFDVADLGDISLERPVAEVSDEDVQKSIDNLRDASTRFEAEEGRAAADGDQVKIDFVGKIDGEAFDGGTADDFDVVIGRGQFIPGFEEGLVGLKAGDKKDIETKFPEDYGAKELAGKAAVFATTVKEVQKPIVPEIDDEFAKNVGFDDLDKLKETIKERLGDDFKKASRGKLKRQLLDALDEKHKFELPPTLVETEFDGVWKQVTQGLEQAGRTFEDEGKTEEEVKNEYHELAERRVRLGLLLAHLAEDNNIQVSEEELKQAMFQEVSNYPGQEQQVYEYFQKNPQAVLQLRGPILEDKTVDFILEQVKITDKTVTAEELFKQDDDSEDES